MTINLVAICGPTASGKTRIGVAVAQAIGGEIISVDSRQVYRGLDLGSGKDLSEYATPDGPVPYHLIDCADPGDIYTLWHYQRDFYRAFNEIRERGRMPVAVGGTGLYLEAVLKGYDIPNVPEDPVLRRQLMNEEKPVLENRLHQLDPARYERTDRSSKKRIVRALEVSLAGKPPDHAAVPAARPDIRPLVIGVRSDRAVLHDRIRTRLDARFAAGMVDEVRRLLDAGVSRDRMELFGLEYRHITRHLLDSVPFTTMREELLRDIRRLAKRQQTWFRGMERRGIAVTWVANADTTAAVGTVREELERQQEQPPVHGAG